MIQTYIIAYHGASPHGASPPQDYQSSNTKADFVNFILILAIILWIVGAVINEAKRMK